MRVKYLKVRDGERLHIDDYPSFSRTGSIVGMANLYYGKDALLVRCGSYIYNVSGNPIIYYEEAY